MSKKPITVYLAPCTSPESDGVDWGFLYPRPSVVFSNLIKEKSENIDKASFLSCPAFSNLTKKTIQYCSPMSASYKYDFTNKDNPIFMPTSDNYIATSVVRSKILNEGNSVFFQLSYLMFSDEPLETLFTLPYFAKPEYIKYGTPIPGQFDIGQWFRPFNFEVQMWSDVGEFHIKENEPLFYAQFQTDRPIVFKHFEMNEKLKLMSLACVDTTSFFGKGQSLKSRYLRFNNTGFRNRVLSEIKKNIIE